MPEPNRRPNLIYVFADQLRYVSCGFAGDPFALFLSWGPPHDLDALAEIIRTHFPGDAL